MEVKVIEEDIIPANMNQTVFLSGHCYHPTKRKSRIFNLRFETKNPAGFAKNDARRQLGTGQLS